MAARKTPDTEPKKTYDEELEDKARLKAGKRPAQKDEDEDEPHVHVTDREKKAAAAEFSKRRPLEGERLLKVIVATDAHHAQVQRSYQLVDWIVEFSKQVKRSPVWDQRPPRAPDGASFQAVPPVQSQEDILEIIAGMARQVLRVSDGVLAGYATPQARRLRQINTDRNMMLGVYATMAVDYYNEQAVKAGVQAIKPLTNAELALLAVAAGYESPKDSADKREERWKKRRGKIVRASVLFVTFNSSVSQDAIDQMLKAQRSAAARIAAGGDPNAVHDFDGSEEARRADAVLTVANELLVAQAGVRIKPPPGSS